MENPRRTPKQDRSRSLVDAVVGAASHVLGAVGLERATTTRIAERAGVSIGSLYQYFGNRDELIGRAVERRIEENLRIFSEEMESKGATSASDFLHRLVGAGLDRFLDHRRFYKPLLTYAPILDRAKLVVRARRSAYVVIARALEKHASELRAVDTRIAAFVMLNAFMGVVLMAVEDEEADFDRAALHEELHRLFAAYLLEH